MNKPRCVGCGLAVDTTSRCARCSQGGKWAHDVCITYWAAHIEDPSIAYPGGKDGRRLEANSDTGDMEWFCSVCGEKPSEYAPARRGLKVQAFPCGHFQPSGLDCRPKADA